MIEHEGKRYENVSGDCEECEFPCDQGCDGQCEQNGEYGKRLRLLPEAPQPDLTEFGYADGMYEQRCTTCSKQHMADKRAWNCKECAINLSIRISAPQDHIADSRKAGNESSFATTYPTIELRGVETGNDIAEQYQKIIEESFEETNAYADITRQENMSHYVDELWDGIRVRITALRIIEKQTGIPITEGRDRHLAKMDERGYKERKKEG